MELNNADNGKAQPTRQIKSEENLIELIAGIVVEQTLVDVAEIKKDKTTRG